MRQSSVKFPGIPKTSYRSWERPFNRIEINVASWIEVSLGLFSEELHKSSLPHARSMVRIPFPPFTNEKDNELK